MGTNGFWQSHTLVSTELLDSKVRELLNKLRNLPKIEPPGCVWSRKNVGTPSSTRSPCLLLFWSKRTRWKDPTTAEEWARRKMRELTKRVVLLALGRDGSYDCKAKALFPFLSLVEQKVSLKFGRAHRRISSIGIYSVKVQVVRHLNFDWPKTNHGLQTQFWSVQTQTVRLWK